MTLRKKNTDLKKTRDQLSRAVHDLQQAQANAQYSAYENAKITLKLSDSEARVLVLIEEQAATKKLLLEQGALIDHLIDTSPELVTITNIRTKKHINVTRPFSSNRPLTPAEARKFQKNDAFRLTGIHPEDLPTLYAFYEQFLSFKDGHVEEMEFRTKSSTGAIRWFHVRSRVFRPGKGKKPVYLISAIRDITSRRKFEREITEVKLRHQKAMLEAVISSQESERERLGEALHNGIAQLLYAVQTHLLLIRNVPPPDLAVLDKVRSIVDEAIYDARQMSFDLVPATLKDHGLLVALQTLAEKLSNDRLKILVSVKKSRKLDGRVELAAYRIIQEALNNVIRHAKASTAQVDVVFEAGKLRVQVRDNGAGFDLQAAREIASGIGLATMSNRVKLLGGSLEIVSQKNRGTEVKFTLNTAGKKPART